ncbi:hypothetical protein B7486_32930 [cyanobacterium TDX16]|nr:hypothetical protein B7486_32930 [cyanobacterium TDX16]
MFEHLKQEWRSLTKVRGMSSFGERNPMFGVTHSETTKIKISARAKARFQDPTFREKFLNSEKRKQYHASRKGIKIGSLVARVALTCAYCNRVFQVVPNMAQRKNKKYCSYTCFVNAQHGKTATTEMEVRQQVLAFAESVKDELFEVKLNKLKPLF